MEQTLIDSLGNTITLTYDAETDVVKVKNSGVDSDFREVNRQPVFDDPSVVLLGLETPNNGDDGWNEYSDDTAKSEIRNFWTKNKVDQS